MLDEAAASSDPRTRTWPRCSPRSGNVFLHAAAGGRAQPTVGTRIAEGGSWFQNRCLFQHWLHLSLEEPRNDTFLGSISSPSIQMLQSKTT